MSGSDELGVLVVGYGMVGKIRTRDVKKCEADTELQNSPLSRLRLRGVVTRRPQEGVTDVPFMSLEEGLKRDDVSLVIVTTENSDHYNTAKRALEVGKHVLVEFPLTLSAANTKELLQIAKEKGVVCYEEDLSLILKAADTIKSRIDTSPPVKECLVELLSRPMTGWKVSLEGAGSPFMASVSLLQDLLVFFGDLTPKNAFIKVDGDKLTAEGHLVTLGNRPVRMRVNRAPENGMRAVKFSATFDDNTSFEIPLDAGPDERKGLFMRDLERCVKTVLGDRQQDDWLVKRSAELADELTQLAKTAL